MIRCKLCGKKFTLITNTHLKFVHGCNLSDYTKRFGTKNCGFLSPNLLPKNDLRYIRWRESLKKRPPPWSKGYTKETHPGVLKISKTFKRKKIDNFAEWREKMKKLGRWPSEKDYAPIKESGDLAELIGVILGDGNIQSLPRTEQLIISSNSNNKKFIERYAGLLDKIFKKKAVLMKDRDKNCIRIRIYQKYISKRLDIPTGSKRNIDIRIPRWIVNNKSYLKRYLRGLYEAEGSFCIHKPTYTYKFLFANKNESLLQNVFRALKILRFHPHKSKYKIQISKKEEVYKVKELIKFRQY